MAEKKDDIKLIKKILSILWRIFYQLLIVLCIILILIIVMQRVTNSNNSIKGFRLFRVISGSMVPQYDIGQVVICKDMDISDLKVGDTIVYRGNSGEFDGKIIMHNIVSIKTAENGQTIVVTQGLYNTVGDPEITESQIYGKVIMKAQILTVFYDLSNNLYTFFVIIVVLVLNIFISWKKPEQIKRAFENDDNNNDNDNDNDNDVGAGIARPLDDNDNDNDDNNNYDDDNDDDDNDDDDNDNDINNDDDNDM